MKSDFIGIPLTHFLTWHQHVDISFVCILNLSKMHVHDVGKAHTQAHLGQCVTHQTKICHRVRGDHVEIQWNPGRRPPQLRDHPTTTTKFPQSRIVLSLIFINWPSLK
jgi:hypothetical protein